MENGFARGRSLADNLPTLADHAPMASRHRHRLQPNPDFPCSDIPSSYIPNSDITCFDDIQVADCDSDYRFQHVATVCATENPKGKCGAFLISVLIHSKIICVLVCYLNIHHGFAYPV